VYGFLDRHPDLAQRYDPRTDPALRQDIQRYFRDRDYDETVAQLLGILGGWRIDNPPVDESDGSSSGGAIGLIALALPFDISDCLPFDGFRGSSPPVNRSPQASFDDGIPPRSRMHRSNSPSGGGSALFRLDTFLSQPEKIHGKSVSDIATMLRENGISFTIRNTTGSVKTGTVFDIKGHDIQQMRWHPGGGRHGGSYWTISTSSKGKIKVVDKDTYIPTPGEKATIIYGNK
jgi:hypothetical protein